ncbi:ATP-binding cassette domain-containing protein [Reyranella sp.]|uniref:ATP-binding cassette domain-containing protein n=1 Tax=Reyranella sp. TaxID=1929291 RepID=UPI003D09C945
MITLHGISKTVGHGSRTHEVLREINWKIEPKSRHVILATGGAGKTTLLDVISGWLSPTEGWVERQGVVSSTKNLVRGDPGTTVRQLIRGLCILYVADPLKVEEFVRKYIMMDDVHFRQVRTLNNTDKRALNSALFYALPCDYYLFDDQVHRLPPKFLPSGEQAYRMRAGEAGMILATSRLAIARDFGGQLSILHGGRLFPFNDFKEGLAVFRKLPETPAPGVERTPDREETEDDSGLDAMI